MFSRRLIAAAPAFALVPVPIGAVSAAAAPDPILAPCHYATAFRCELTRIIELELDERSPEFRAVEAAYDSAHGALEAMTPTSIEGLRALLVHAAAAYGPPEQADYSDDPWAGVVAQIRRGLEQMIDRG
jgi:hypothetical protein